MKKAILLNLLVAGLVAAMVFTLASPAAAQTRRDEIQVLKKMLLDLQRKRDAELEELRKRIEALENERTEQRAPQKEIGKLKKSVTELQGRLEKQSSFYERVGQFMETHKLKAGLRTQAWYQFVEDGKHSGTKDLHDFMLRRFYFYLKGEVIPKLGFFAHIAGDRLGQDGLDKSGVGLGTGIAVRDAWLYYYFNDSFRVQIGRMYVPFTRNYGTTSTFALLPLELPFNQGGVRGGIFYASKVGRDDGVVFWGNPLKGRFQYRLGISEGVEGNDNPDDNLRFVGRLSLNLLEPETSWFNKGTYLGKKRVLALGAGFDYQDDLTLNGKSGQDNLGWTFDLFFDQPVKAGAVTVEAAYIGVNNVTQTLKYSWLTKGDNADMYYIQGGYLLPWRVGPGRLQPYFRYEYLDVKDRPDTAFPCAGVNYYLKGHSAKVTLDWTQIDQRRDFSPTGNYSGRDQNLITFQLSAGF